MAFYLSTNGQLHPYHFSYLAFEFEKARLERTEIHSEHSENKPRPQVAGQKEIYAIDVMSRPVISMPGDCPLAKIREEMKMHDVRHIAIALDHKIIGMISDRDLLKVDLDKKISSLKAEDVMSTVLVVAEEETPLAHIARVLMEEKISALPIINQSQQLVGMISRTDILKAVVYNRLVFK